MVLYELVLELREFLSEHVYTCFFTHYYFEHDGKRLNDYTELAELNLTEDSKIYMRPGTLLDLIIPAQINMTRRVLETISEESKKFCSPHKCSSLKSNKT